VYYTFNEENNFMPWPSPIPPISTKQKHLPFTKTKTSTCHQNKNTVLSPKQKHLPLTKTKTSTSNQNRNIYLSPKQKHLPLTKTKIFSSPKQKHLPLTNMWKGSTG